MAQVKITIRKNGPYRVEAPEGSVELVDSEGNKFDLTGKPAFSLCRCGGSVNKPFCDGTHSKSCQRKRSTHGKHNPYLPWSFALKIKAPSSAHANPLFLDSFARKRSAHQRFSFRFSPVFCSVL